MRRRRQRKYPTGNQSGEPVPPAETKERLTKCISTRAFRATLHGADLNVNTFYSLGVRRLDNLDIAESLDYFLVSSL